jgi:sugar (pentulose or hexulose) kinase
VVSDLVLGLDAGTTAIKAAAFDTDGHEVATGSAPTPWRNVETGAELDADDLIVAAIAAARDALRETEPGRVVAIGVASMAETGVLLDSAARPVVPAIAWHDTRGVAEAKRIGDELGESGFSARVGLPATPVCTLAKYRWMRDHWPAAGHGVRWLNVAEWIVLGFGGNPAAELSLASRTGFYDLGTRRVWPDALAWADAPAGLMPEAVVAGTPMGRAGSALEAARGAVLTVGGHDHLAAAVGAGAAAEGDVLDSCGTAEAFVRTTAPVSPEAVGRAVDAGLSVGWHAVEGHHAILGALWSGASFQHVLALLGVPPAERGLLEASALEIERRGPAPTVTVTGIGEPTLALHGIDRDASPAAAYHATLAAAGAVGADILARMAAIAGPARRILVAGGWAAGEAARAVKQRYLGEVCYLPATFTGARGAALAAGRAAGVWAEPISPALEPARARPAPPHRR